MGFFGGLFDAGRTGAYVPEYTPRPMSELIASPAENIRREPENDTRRTCWVRGQKAMFHRWVESAHPVVPRNVPEEQIDEKTRSFQYWSTQALVELEDGSCVRVWPNEVQFADGGRFADRVWLPMTEGGQGDGAE